jgi:3-hydroxybutyryl-CoA dehydrogenase
MGERVAVVGTGLMGTGIAEVAALHGHDLVLCGRSEESAQRARDLIVRSLDQALEGGKLTEDARASAGAITPTASLEAVAGSSIVIESVVEDVTVKQEIFRALDSLCQGATLLTNTSAISVDRIASATGCRDRVAGAHFFAPVQKTRLCEITRASATSDETIERARQFATGIGKTCIVIDRDIPGMVTTRLMMALGLAAIRLVESGVAAADIDTACKLAFGHAMGPLATADLSGIDVLKNVAETLYKQTLDPGFLTPPIILDMVEAGHLGRKSGQGFHSYH